MHQPMKFRERFGVVVVAAVIACQVAAPTVAWAHGGGGGHGGGGFGGGGGRAMGGGGFGGGGRDFGGGGRDFGGGGRDFGGGDFRGGDFGGARDFGGDRGLDGGARDFGGDRGLDGGARDFGGDRALDGGGRLDGGRPLDGGAARDLGAGRFAGGAGELSRADFQRIANPGVGRDAFGRGAVRPYTAGALADRGGMIRTTSTTGAGIEAVAGTATTSDPGGRAAGGAVGVGGWEPG